MKLATVFFLLIVQTGFAQDCSTRAKAKPATSTRSPDVFVNDIKGGSANITKMKQHLGRAESWVKNILTDFTGAKLSASNDFYFDYEYNDSYSANFYQSGGIKGSYSFKMRFFAYYCYDNKDQIYTEGESGSFVNVSFNNLFISGLCSDAGVVAINGRPVFRILEKSHSKGRVDFYDFRVKSTVNDTIYTSKRDIFIIRNSDKPVFITVTRKEYLDQLIIDLETYRTRMKTELNHMYNSQLKQFEDEVKIYKTLDKTYTAEKEASQRKKFNEANNPAKLAQDIKKLDTEVNGAADIVRQYQKKPGEWLSRNFSSFYPFAFYTAAGLRQYFDGLDNFTESKADLTRKEVVFINPAYFNKALGNDVPQLIAVDLQKKAYPHMLKVSRLVKQDGVFGPLEAILNGKTTPAAVVSPATTSNYRLTYLPKLPKLTSLAVPANMKPSAVSVTGNYNNNPAVAKFNVEIPTLSPKLSQLPQPLTTEMYKTYTQQLYTSISTALKPDEKTRADEYVKNKKLTNSKNISNAALAAWIQNAPKLSLYLYGKAVTTNPSDALAANNFSAFLIMGGLPEKAIPVLEYWNKQKPGETTLLCNLGNAYYRLGDMAHAKSYLQQCVQYDTLNPIANKILCIIHLKQGDAKKAQDHGVRSITASHDQQVIAILRQLNSKIRPGEIMSRLTAKEFPLLKRTKLPAMPSALDDMEKFLVELEAEKKSLDITIEGIEAKIPGTTSDVQQKTLMAGLTGGLSSLRVKAQFIIMDAMAIYQEEKTRESDVFKHQLKILAAPYNIKMNAISKKYAVQLNKLEGGEAGDEAEIAALELARCKEMNAEKEKYLAGLSSLVNGYAQRQEFISRKFYRDYANWGPYWTGGMNFSFLSIEKDYLKDIAGILSEYPVVNKSDCSVFEPLAKKEGTLKEWEDEYCANFKGKIGVGPAEIFWTCNSWGVEGGEGLVGELEMKYGNDGSFEDFTIGGGLGENWTIGDGHVVELEASASIKEFIKIGPNKATGKWEVKDFGFKTEGSLEAGIGNATAEVKILELSVAVNAGLEAGGVLAPVLNLR